MTDAPSTSTSKVRASTSGKKRRDRSPSPYRLRQDHPPEIGQLYVSLPFLISVYNIWERRGDDGRVRVVLLRRESEGHDSSILPTSAYRILTHVPLLSVNEFWQHTISTAEALDDDFKRQALPLARIKKVMKSDPEVRMISSEVTILFEKACQIFIQELTARSHLISISHRRRTLAQPDVAQAISKSDMFDFLIDIVPRDDGKEEGKRRKKGKGKRKVEESSEEEEEREEKRFKEADEVLVGEQNEADQEEIMMQFPTNPSDPNFPHPEWPQGSFDFQV